MRERTYRITSGQRVAVSSVITLFLIVLVAAVLLNACGTAVPAAVAVSRAGSVPEISGGTAVAAAPAPTQIVIHVVGEVTVPGVISLPAGSRVSDAIDAAGGPTADAELASVNLARLLVDGEQIVVRAPGEMAPAGVGMDNSGTVTGEVGLVNINTAGSEQLQALPRIGPATAQKIIDYRTSMGGFASIDELRNVSGIGEKTFEALRERVTV